MTTNYDAIIADLNSDEKDGLIRELLAQREAQRTAVVQANTSEPEKEKIEVVRTIRRTAQSILGMIDGVATNTAVGIAKMGGSLNNYESGLLLMSADWHNDLASDIEKKYGSEEAYVQARKKAIGYDNLEAVLQAESKKLWLNR